MEAGQTRQHGASSEAPRELVLQFSEHEGSPGVGGDDSSRTQHQADLHKDEGYDAEKVETGRPRPHEESGELQVSWCSKEMNARATRRPGRPVAESGRSGVQEEDSALRQQASKGCKAEASPVSELRGKNARDGLLAGSSRQGCPGQGRWSGSQEGVTLTAAEKGKSGDEGDESDSRTADLD